MYKIALGFVVIGLVACDGESLSQNNRDCSNDGIGCNEGFECEPRELSGYECVPEVEPDAMVLDAISPAPGRDGGGEMRDPALDAGGSMVEVDAADAGPASDQGVSDPMGRTRSYKRGIAYGFDSPRDLEALSQGVSWWYNWSPRYNEAVADVYAEYALDWVPMTWNGNNAAEIRAFLEQHPNVRYLLGFNEPNFSDQANLTPDRAAELWPQYEQIAEDFDLQLVGPAVNYCGGCVMVDGSPIENDYIVWLDMFIEAYQTRFGRAPRMDFTALHWYDFGLPEQVDRIVTRYGRPVWLTEFALWRGEDWNTPEFERDWLLEMVALLEENEMVYRYSWFTGRRPDFPRINLLDADGQLTPLGRAYVEAPFGDTQGR